MYENKPGVLLLMSGPSGAGKSTLCTPLLETEKRLSFSVSCTTRAPRQGEVEGSHYHFVSKDEFKQKIRQGDFLEWAEVHGNFYGTLKSEVEEHILAGNDVLLDIDVQGAMQIREMLAEQNRLYPDKFSLFDAIVYVFVTPPSFEALKQRLEARGTETATSLKKRLDNALFEIKHQLEYDFIIVNDKLEKARADLKAILSAARCRTAPLKHL